MLTIREVLNRTSEYFARKGHARARLEAEVLLAHVLGARRLDLYLQMEKILTEDETARYREAVRRRGEGEPVAYITGHKEFFGLEFEVSEAVLIPRPETEELVELAAAWIGSALGGAANGERQSREAVEFTFFDVGTGSGAIALALLHLFPRARGWAGDVSAAALDVARRNAERLGLADRLTFLEGPEFAGFAGPPVDLVISNPPYVRRDEEHLVTPEALRFEPHGAIFGGERGTEIIEAILADAPRVLRPGGRVMFEISPMVVPELEKALAAPVPFASQEFRSDSSNKIRFLILDFPNQTK